MGVYRNQTNNLIKKLVDTGKLVAMVAWKNRHYTQSKSKKIMPSYDYPCINQNIMTTTIKGNGHYLF